MRTSPLLYVLLLVGAFFIGLVTTLAVSHAVAGPRGATPPSPNTRLERPAQAPGGAPQGALPTIEL